MNIFAAIKKAINSNLDKPLNITLDEIKSDVKSVNKITTMNVCAVGVPYNTTYDKQILSESDAPVLSIEGVGRILAIFPVVKSTSGGTTHGTSLITVDNNIIHNSRIRYSSYSTSQAGMAILGPDFTTATAVVLNAFDATTAYYINSPTIKVLGHDVAFTSNDTGILTPRGVPFNQKVDIRLTQATQSDTSKAGVVVVYELYE